MLQHRELRISAPGPGEPFAPPLLPEIVEKPGFSDEFILSPTGKISLHGPRRPGQIIVEVGEKAFEVRVRADLRVAVGGLVRTMTPTRFVRDGEDVIVLKERTQTGLTAEDGLGAFVVSTTYSSETLSFYPDISGEDVRITATAGQFESDL